MNQPGRCYLMRITVPPPAFSAPGPSLFVDLTPNSPSPSALPWEKYNLTIKATQEPSPCLPDGVPRPPGAAFGTSAASLLSASPRLAGTPRLRWLRVGGGQGGGTGCSAPYLAGASSPRGTPGTPPGARRPRLDPPRHPRRRQVHRPGAAPVPRPRTLESFKRVGL